MELSKRLSMIVNKADKCRCIADIGTDHGYVASELLKKCICDKVIATDINKGPLEKARITLLFDGFSDKSEVRLGSGLRTIKKGETQGIIIAGMGGNLIRDLVNERINIAKDQDYLILQPAQNPEVLRKYLYNERFEILDEDVCFDENKYYECFKVRYNSNLKHEIRDSEDEFLEEMRYEISPFLLKNGGDIFKDYMNHKIEKYEQIMSHLNNDTENSIKRREEISKKVKYIKDMVI